MNVSNLREMGAGIVWGRAYVMLLGCGCHARLCCRNIIGYETWLYTQRFVYCI